MLKEIHMELAARSFQSDDSCAPAAGLRGGILKADHEVRVTQHGTHNLALHADAAAVDDAKGLESQAIGLREVLLYNGSYVSRGNAMQIEHIGNGNPNRFLLHSTNEKARPA